MSISSAAAPDIIRVRRRQDTAYLSSPRPSRSIFSAARGPRPSPRFRLLGEGSGRKRSISGLATEKEEEKEETPTSSSFTTRRRRESERGAVVKEQGHGPPSLSPLLPSLRQRPTKLIRQLNSPLSSSLPRSNSLARSIRGRTDGLTRNKKERYFVAASDTSSLLSRHSLVSRSLAACPFVRQSDSPSVLRGLLPLPPTSWWRESARLQMAASLLFMISSPADNNILS